MNDDIKWAAFAIALAISLGAMFVADAIRDLAKAIREDRKKGGTP